MAVVDLTMDIIEREQTLRTDRLIYEPTWEQIGDIIRPLRKDINNVDISPGQPRRELIFDGTPEQALNNYAAGVYGTMTNPASEWFRVSTGDPDFDEFYLVQIYLRDVTRLLQKSFYSCNKDL